MNGTLNETDVFLSAIEIDDPNSREAYLDGAVLVMTCLRQRVEALLRQHLESKGMLDAPPPGLVATIGLPTITEQPGTVIGPYKLLQQIGEGGMGVVFMAEQTEPIQRTVALKIIKPGMDTRQVIARFEAERQALAMMDHPNIAKVLDAGTTDSGPAVLRDGAGERRRQSPSTATSSTCRSAQRLELFMPGLPGRAARPSERHHPSRHQALNVLVAEYDDQAGSQGHRLRRGQGHGAKADRTDDVHRVRPGDRHAGVHEPRAGRGSTSSTSTPAATSIRWVSCSTNC